MIEQLQKPFFMILVGAPGSGKSTFLAELLSSIGNVHVASTDDLIEAEAKRSGRTYEKVMQQEKFAKFTREMEAQLTKALKDGRSVVLDQTNLSVKKRKERLALAPVGYMKVAHVFNVPLDVIKKRVHERGLRTGKVIPMGIVVNMWKSLEPPTYAEGYDLISEVRHEADPGHREKDPTA